MSSRLFVLPGMGATSEMYRGPWRDLSSAVFLDWPNHDGEDTIAAIASSIARASSASSSDMLAGCSLGGIVALELARELNVGIVCLIGSAREPGEINPLLRLMAPSRG